MADWGNDNSCTSFNVRCVTSRNVIIGAVVAIVAVCLAFLLLCIRCCRRRRRARSQEQSVWPQGPAQLGSDMYRRPETVFVWPSQPQAQPGSTVRHSQSRPETLRRSSRSVTSPQRTSSPPALPPHAGAVLTRRSYAEQSTNSPASPPHAAASLARRSCAGQPSLASPDFPVPAVPLQNRFSTIGPHPSPRPTNPFRALAASPSHTPDLAPNSAAHDTMPGAASPPSPTVLPPTPRRASRVSLASEIPAPHPPSLPPRSPPPSFRSMPPPSAAAFRTHSPPPPSFTSLPPDRMGPLTGISVRPHRLAINPSAPSRLDTASVVDENNEPPPAYTPI